MFKFLEYAPVKFISAKTGAGVESLFPLIREVYEAASRRIPTAELNRWVEQLHFEERKILRHAGLHPPALVRHLHRRQRRPSSTSSSCSPIRRRMQLRQVKNSTPAAAITSKPARVRDEGRRSSAGHNGSSEWWAW